MSPSHTPDQPTPIPDPLLPRTRRRPLVTYGKRKPAPRETTPPPKRRRSEPPTQRAPSPIEDTCTAVASSPPPRPPPPSPPKSSLLRYFSKVTTSPTSTTERSVTPVSVQQSKASTPLSSPAKTETPESRPRSRRRLTTRPFTGLDTLNAQDNEQPRDDDNLDPEGSTLQTFGGTSPRSTTSDTSSTKEMSTNKTNSSCTCSDRRCRHGRTRTKRTIQKPPAATVQMTLSLSTRDASIKQCRECDMLYNPLHPSDVKHHARHHASVVKMKTAVG